MLFIKNYDICKNQILYIFNSSITYKLDYDSSRFIFITYYFNLVFEVKRFFQGFQFFYNTLT